MPCCIIAAVLIGRFIIRWNRLKAYFGVAEPERNPYGWEEYCELDQFAN